MKINILKDSKDEWLARTTYKLNQVNPIVSRLMNNESVEGVVMTNKEGSPIISNMNLVPATNYGLTMHYLGKIAQGCVREIDPFDEVLVMRVSTRQFEIMVTPHSEFNIIAVQYGKRKAVDQKNKNKHKIK